MAPASPALQVVHENRLQRVEEGLADLRVELAANNARLEGLTITLRDGFEGLSAKLERATEALTRQDEAIRDLQRSRARWTRTTVWVGSGAGAIALAVATAAAKTWLGL